MGSYLIPAARSSREAAEHAFDPTAERTWAVVEGGVLFTDPALTDAECAELYADFVPSGAGEDYRPPLPAYIRDHIPHLRDYRAAVRAGQTVTDAQTTHVVADIIDALRYLNAQVTGD